MILEELAPKQQEAIRGATGRINILDGAVRAGKTVASLLTWLAFVAEGPAGALAMVGKTERTLKHNILDLIAEMIPADEYRLVEGSGEAFIFGRRVYLFGANDERSENKIRGLTLAGLYGDQVEVWPEGFFRMAVSRLSIDGAQFHLTANPEGPRHYLKTGFIDKADEPAMGVRHFHFRLDDNPFLSAEYKAALRAANPGLWGKRYIDGLWVAAEGAIYDAFDEQSHVVGRPDCPVGELPRMLSYWIGIDYGTANPFVALLLGEGQDGRLYVLSEYRWDSRKQRRQKTDGEYSADVIAWLTQLRLFAMSPRGDIEDWLFDRISIDASATSFIAQLWRDGMPGVSKAPAYTVRDGIRAVSALLANQKLLFAEGMLETDTFGEMGEYVWDEHALLRGEERPRKENDHGPDALRYGVMAALNIWKDWISWMVEDDPGVADEA